MKTSSARSGFRKEAEHSLEASRASFTSIVEKTGEGILVISPESVVLYANPGGIILVGAAQRETY